MIIGITGGIASGKSAVSCYLEKKGYPIVDADLLSREIIAMPSTISQIIACFGNDVIVDGAISRQKLGEKIFSDVKARARLDAIMHPLIYTLAKERLLTYTQEELVFFVVPLLYETGFDALCDEVWLVVTDEQVKRQRLMERDAIDVNYAQKKIAAQADDEWRLSHAPQVLRNNDTLENLYAQVEMLLRMTRKNP